MILRCSTNDSIIRLTISNVRYAPQCPATLLSLRQILLTPNTKATVDADVFTFDSNGAIFTATAGFGNLWRLDLADITLNRTLVSAAYSLAALSTSSPGVALWHERMGHILKLLEPMADGVDLDEKPSISVLCETCAKVNIRAQSHDSYCTPGRFPLDLVYSDVESFPVTSFEGYNYYVAFEHDYTKFAEVYPMIHKSEVPTKFKEFKAANETPTRQIHRLRSEHGGEYLHKELATLRSEHGIRWEPSTSNHQMQNGTAERLQQSLHKRASAILTSGKFSERWWAESVGYS